MYRPTVRYHDVFKTYMDSLYDSCTLDRNQLFRLALFTSAHSDEFTSILKNYLKPDSTFPPTLWNSDDHYCWKEQNFDWHTIDNKDLLNKKDISLPSAKSLSKTHDEKDNDKSTQETHSIKGQVKRQKIELTDGVIKFTIT